MTSYTWTGADGADWSVGGNWSPAGGPPGFADTAIVESGGTLSISQAEPDWTWWSRSTTTA